MERMATYPITENGNKYKREVTFRENPLCAIGSRYWLLAKVLITRLADKRADPIDMSTLKLIGCTLKLAWGITWTMPLNIMRVALWAITWPVWAIHELLD